MMCYRCAGKRSGEAPSSTGTPPAERGGSASVTDPRCPGCGAPLHPLTTGEALLDKLVQLAQFGLTAGGGPLFEPSRDSN